jgi:hypothetical protein
MLNEISNPVTSVMIIIALWIVAFITFKIILDEDDIIILCRYLRKNPTRPIVFSNTKLSPVWSSPRRIVEERKAGCSCFTKCHGGAEMLLPRYPAIVLYVQKYLVRFWIYGLGMANTPVHSVCNWNVESVGNVDMMSLSGDPCTNAYTRHVWIHSTPSNRNARVKKKFKTWLCFFPIFACFQTLLGTFCFDPKGGTSLVS